MSNKRFGVIDIGTLKVKLQIVEKLASGILKTVYQSSKLTCLGCGMDQNNNIPKDEYLQNTLNELTRCKKLLTKYRTTKTRVVSTHALREMGEVGKNVANTINTNTGLNVEIISQQEEAELFFKAVLTDFDDKDYVLVDVGGGSVQILIGNKHELKQSFLLKTGTSTLWDKFTPNHKGPDFPNRSEIRKMKNYILKELQPIPKGVKAPIIYGSTCIIDLFKGINLPTVDHSSSKLHPVKASVNDMEKFLDNVWSLSYDDREKKYVSPTHLYMWGIDKAFLNVVELAKRVEAPYVIPSNANINQGLIKSLTDTV